MQITKTDYLEYTFCKKNLWLKKHKPELFDDFELSDFEKKIIEEGNIADEEARHLFKDGILIDSYGLDAINDTKEYLNHNTPTLFQATFSVDSFFIRADILIHNPDLQGWELFEVKATNEVKREKDNNHIRDLAFQKTVIQKAGLTVVKAGVIHLNKEYRYKKKVNYKELFVIQDLTDEITQAQEQVSLEMEQMKEYLDLKEQKGCECLYKGRNKQCTTFAYSNPQVPEYSVHDLNRIGNSKKLLTELIDQGIYSLDDITNPEILTGAKKAQYDSYIAKRPIIDKKAIQERLEELTFPLYFFDYEGYGTAIPEFEGFGPYEQVPFQYSLHILHEDGAHDHNEFLITQPQGDLTKPLIVQMIQDIDPKGTVISWHAQYEKDRNKKLMELHPKHKAFLEEINDKMFDLEKIFSDQLYVDPAFQGRTSIKKVLPVIVPTLSYVGMSIGKGDQASELWQSMVSDTSTPQEKKQIERDLRDYCELDTLAMVKIYEFLLQL